MTASPSRYVALLGIAALTVIWSLNWPVSKVAMRDAGPFAFSAQTYLLGTVVLFALLVALRRPLAPTPWLPTIAVGLTQTVGFKVLMQASLVSGGAGKMAILVYSMPFWTIPLAWWWLNERPDARRWLCIATAVAGFVCVIEPWKPIGTGSSIVFALGCGLSWAIAVVIAKWMFLKYPQVTPLSLTAWQMVPGTLALVAIGLVVPERAVHWSASYVGALLYNGVLACSMAWVVWAAVVRHVPASVAGLTSLAVPLGSVLFAWAFMGEDPSIVEWAGVLLIGCALLALNFSENTRRGAAG